MAGSLRAPDPKPTAPKPQRIAKPIPLHKDHCKHCYDSLGRVSCQQGHYRNLAVYAKLQPGRTIPHVYLLCAERREFGNPYGLDILATFDDTVYANPLASARFMLHHLGGSEKDE